MISKAERAHIVELKKWSIEARAAMEKLQANPLLAPLLKRIASDEDAALLFKNVDWLVALIEREEHRYGVRALTKASQR